MAAVSHLATRKSLTRSVCNRPESLKIKLYMRCRKSRNRMQCEFFIRYNCFVAHWFAQIKGQFYFWVNLPSRQSRSKKKKTQKSEEKRRFTKRWNNPPLNMCLSLFRKKNKDRYMFKFRLKPK